MKIKIEFDTLFQNYVEFIKTQVQQKFKEVELNIIINNNLPDDLIIIIMVDSTFNEYSDLVELDCIKSMFHPLSKRNVRKYYESKSYNITENDFKDICRMVGIDTNNKIVGTSNSISQKSDNSPLS